MKKNFSFGFVMMLTVILSVTGCFGGETTDRGFSRGFEFHHADSENTDKKVAIAARSSVSIFDLDKDIPLTVYYGYQNLSAPVSSERYEYICMAIYWGGDHT